MTCGSPSRLSRFCLSAVVNRRSAKRSVSMAATLALDLPVPWRGGARADGGPGFVPGVRIPACRTLVVLGRPLFAPAEPGQPVEEGEAGEAEDDRARPPPGAVDGDRDRQADEGGDHRDIPGQGPRPQVD